MNNAKWKKTNNGFGEGKGDALYPTGVFIPILSMKKGNLAYNPVAKRRVNHSTTYLLHEREREPESQMRWHSSW